LTGCTVHNLDAFVDFCKVDLRLCRETALNHQAP